MQSIFKFISEDAVREQTVDGRLLGYRAALDGGERPRFSKRHWPRAKDAAAYKQCVFERWAWLIDASRRAASQGANAPAATR